MEAARDDRPGLPALFRDMAATCRRLSAPTYADLAAFVADDVESFGPFLGILEPYADARVGDMVPLRFFAAIQRLVLERRAPELGVFFVTLGGTAPQSDSARAACRAALRQVVAAHGQEIAEGLRWFPQTNEVGRTAALVAVLREIGSQWGLPVRLHEIGASAGLALRADALVGADVVPAEREGIGGVPEIVERLGCDAAPIDPLTTDGRLTLTSFIWPDHPERFERLRGALDLAERVPADVVAQDAVDYVRGLRLHEGTALVLWHSAMWMYLPPESRRAIEQALETLAQEATSEAPLVHVALEPTSEVPGEQHVFRLRMTSWPGMGEVPAGVSVTRATTPPSGLPVSWSVPCVGAIVHDARGRLLLIQRGREPAKGTWSLPGGRVHAGETLAQAVAREVREETGLTVTVGEMVGAVDRAAPDGSTYDIRDFRAHAEGSPQPVAGDDADDARWVTRAEMESLPTSPGLVDALTAWDALPR
ncbi:MAG: DUF2332 family protein [Candidatus Nanopelagicales bacterium]